MLNRLSALGRQLTSASWILPSLVCSFWVVLTINFQWRVHDLGVHTQAVWSCAYEKPLAITLHGGMSMLDHHFSPALCLAAISQIIQPGFQSFVVFCALSVATAGFLLAAYMRRYSNLAAMVMFLFIAFHPAVLNTLNDGPYTNFMNIFWLPLALFFYWTRRWLGFALFMVLAVATSAEEAVWVLLGFGMHAFSYRHWKASVALFSSGMLGLILVAIWREYYPLVGSHIFSNFGSTPFEAMENMLLHPWLLLVPPGIDITARASVVIALFLAFGGAGFLWRRTWLIVLPHIWVIYALEGFYVVQSWRWHYFIPEYGLCALTVADFLGTKVAPWLEQQVPLLKQRSRELYIGSLLAWFAGASLFVSIKFPAYHRLDWEALNEAAALIPADASAAAGWWAAPFIGARRCAVELEYLTPAGMCPDHLVGSCDSDCPQYILIDGNDAKFSKTQYPDYKPVFERDKVALLERTGRKCFSITPTVFYVSSGGRG